MRSHLRTVVVAVLGLLLAVPSLAGAQNEGLGEVDFPNSGAAEAQQAFESGLLLLHSFEYEDAAEAFREAQAIDPDFAMAYWGEAMTYNHPLWFRQDRDAAIAALERLGATAEERYAKAGSERERAWLRAVHALYGEGDKEARDHDYMRVMRQIAEAHPEDAEAKTFYALSILGTCHDGRDFARYMQAAALAEQVYESNPQHPGALHYLIHSYDDPVHAPLGLRAARLYSRVAARAGHALHMPTHIFFALGMWDEAIRLNERSWQASLERRERKGLGLEARGYHARLWQHYALLQQGRYQGARAMLQELLDDVAAVGNDQAASPGPRLHNVVAGMRAQAIVAGDLKSAQLAAELEAAEYSRAQHLYGSAVVALHDGDRAAAEAAQDEVVAMLEADDDQGPRGMRIVALELQALLAVDAGAVDHAVELLTEAAAIEDAIPFDFGPPSPVKPAHELLADVLAGAGRPDDAVAHYERALERTPGRAITLLGLARAASAAGLDERARLAYAELRANWAEADPDLAALDEVRESAVTADDSR